MLSYLWFHFCLAFHTFYTIILVLENKCNTVMNGSFKQWINTKKDLGSNITLYATDGIKHVEGPKVLQEQKIILPNMPEKVPEWMRIFMLQNYTHWLSWDKSDSIFFYFLLLICFIQVDILWKYIAFQSSKNILKCHIKLYVYLFQVSVM